MDGYRVLKVRLGEAAKLPAAEAYLGSAGWSTFPIIGGRKVIVQWGTGRTPANNLTYNCDVSFPISFPVACLAVSHCSGVQTADLDKNSRYRSLKQEVTFGMASLSGVQAQLIVTDGSEQDGRFFYWMAIGY